MKVAICGAGDIGSVHLETLAAIAGVEVVAASDPDAARLAAAAARGARTFASSEEMIDKTAADIVTIATPTQFHASLARKALGRGMHVFCEKPMARTYADGAAMVEAARKADRQLGIGYSLRWHDAYRLARDYIREGKLGRVGTVRTSRCAAAAPRWLEDVKANGGAVFELLTHDLDWLRWSLGPVKRIFTRGRARGADTVEKDYCLAVLRFENGTIGHLEGSLAEVGDFYATYEIAGSEGLLAYDTRKSATLETRVETGEGVRIAANAPGRRSVFAREFEAFVSAVREGRPFEVSGEEALPALRLAEAAFESLQSGRPVEPGA
jgi:predicted dehydrogenase